MLNFTSPLIGKCASGNPAMLLPLRKREFPDEGREGEKLFPSSLFLLLWRVSYKKKKRGVRTTFADKFPIERE